MPNPLLMVLYRLLTGQEEKAEPRRQGPPRGAGGPETSTGVLLVLRRMRA